MAETGVALGVCTNSRVLSGLKKKKKKNKAYTKSPENREWISVIEIIFADRQAVRLIIILKSQPLSNNLVPIQYGSRTAV